MRRWGRPDRDRGRASSRPVQDEACRRADGKALGLGMEVGEVIQFQDRTGNAEPAIGEIDLVLSPVAKQITLGKPRRSDSVKAVAKIGEAQPLPQIRHPRQYGLLTHGSARWRAVCFLSSIKRGSGKRITCHSGVERSPKVTPQVDDDPFAVMSGPKPRD